MINSDKVNKILYGGDYNPEQWPEEIWEEDIKFFKEANIDVVTLNVFSWAALQPSENEYDFSKLDKIMNFVKKHDLKVCLATSTGAHPAWMAKRHPDICRVEFNGIKRKFGGRHNSCPSSHTYREYSVKLADKLAERYKNYDNIVAWHISNEFGGHCYCDNCAAEFREWLKKKYKTLENLNEKWNTAFWSHTFYDWDEIELPNMLTEHFEYERTMFQGITIDYYRFFSDAQLDRYMAERDVLKKHTPNIQITTNLMGFFKQLDYQKWAKEMDFVSWDSYPLTPESEIGTIEYRDKLGNSKPKFTIKDEKYYSDVSMPHDLTRGLKDGLPFVLMEQTPSVTNWQYTNNLKRPNIMRLQSYQAIAHGSDTVMFFQMRRSKGACEKFHGAVIDHAASNEARVFKEITALGKELTKIGDRTLGSEFKSDVAILFDWENWWGISNSSGPHRDLKYEDEVKNYYNMFHSNNIAADIIGVDSDLSKYKLVIAPVLYMVKNGYAEKLEEFVNNGGTFITTYLAGTVNEFDLALGAYPGPLTNLLGVWVEENDALQGHVENSFTYNGKRFPARLICDLMHTRGAEEITKYEHDFYAGMPAITKNSFGKGNAYYVATRSNTEFYEEFLGNICKELSIKPVIDAPKGIGATKRYRKQDGKAILFLMNFSQTEEVIKLDAKYNDLLTGSVLEAGTKLKVDSKDVRVLEEI